MPNWTKRLQEAERHLNEGRLAEAEKLTAVCLAQQPRNASVQYLHGVVLVQTGRHEEGLQFLRKAIAAAPKDGNMAFGLARLLDRLGRFGEATALFRQAVALQPKRDDYWHRLGRNLARTGHVDEGIAALQKALALNAKNDKALYSLGTALMGQGRNAEAEDPFEHLLKLTPNNHATLSNLGVVCLQQGKIDAAARHFSAAIAHAPNEASYHANLGTALMYAHRHEEAASALSRAAQLDPKDARAFANLSVVLQDQVRHDEAVKAIQQAIKLNSTPSGPWHNLLMSLFYLPDHDAEACFRQHKAWGTGIEATTPPAPARASRGKNPAPLRVGLVSPDFRTHPVSAFIAPILETMDRRRIALIAFPQQGMRDEMTVALKAKADDWHEIQSLGDQAAAALIRDQGIDVLVDLAGHTTSNRLALFARQPAPVQATYLGYPGTTGLSRIHYRLTDHHADPPGQTDKFHTEKLSRLPGSFLCYRPPLYAPTPSPAPREARGFVTFGSFNNLKKLNANVITAWVRVLEQTPGARLLIKSAPLSDDGTSRRIAALFASQGIDAARLELRGHVPTLGGHLAAYHDIDIALDTFPYNGTTTTCEALWMGVPVIGLAGASHVSRVGVSILKTVGLDDLIGATVADYVDLAVALAGDRERLSGLRASLRRRVAASPLTDEKGFCDGLAAAFEAMWRERTS